MIVVHVARKPLIGTLAKNVLEWGTGGLNIDACRIPGDKGRFYRRKVGENGIYGHFKGEGWVEDDGLGRWPANLVVDAGVPLPGDYVGFKVVGNPGE